MARVNKHIMKPLAWKREGECIVVTSHAPNSNGYHEIARGGKKRLVHRMVCTRRYGPLGPLLATHSCDNRSCINPDHLRPGTHLQNAAEMIERHRHNRARGEKHGSAKLTATQVIEIFHATGRRACIGARYGVSAATVSDIKTKRRWRHLWP